MSVKTHRSLFTGERQSQASALDAPLAYMFLPHKSPQSSCVADCGSRRDFLVFLNLPQGRVAVHSFCTRGRTFLVAGRRASGGEYSAANTRVFLNLLNDCGRAGGNRQFLRVNCRGHSGVAWKRELVARALRPPPLAPRGAERAVGHRDGCGLVIAEVTDRQSGFG